jgi:hypothetical protein
MTVTRLPSTANIIEETRDRLLKKLSAEAGYFQVITPTEESALLLKLELFQSQTTASKQTLENIEILSFAAFLSKNESFELSFQERVLRWYFLIQKNPRAKELLGRSKSLSNAEEFLLAQSVEELREELSRQQETFSSALEKIKTTLSEPDLIRWDILKNLNNVWEENLPKKAEKSNKKQLLLVSLLECPKRLVEVLQTSDWEHLVLDLPETEFSEFGIPITVHARDIPETSQIEFYSTENEEALGAKKWFETNRQNQTNNLALITTDRFYSDTLQNTTHALWQGREQAFLRQFSKILSPAHPKDAALLLKISVELLYSKSTPTKLFAQIDDFFKCYFAKEISLETAKLPEELKSVQELIISLKTALSGKKIASEFQKIIPEWIDQFEAVRKINQPHLPSHFQQNTVFRSWLPALQTLEFLKDQPISGDEFFQLLSLLIRDTNAPKFPEGVVPLFDARFHSLEEISILGCVEGRYPEQNRITPFLTEYLRKELGFPTEEEKSNRDRYCFYLLQERTKKQRYSAARKKADGAHTSLSRFLIETLTNKAQERYGAFLEGRKNVAEIKEEPSEKNPKKNKSQPNNSIYKDTQSLPLDFLLTLADSYQLPQTLSVQSICRYERSPFEFFLFDVLKLEEAEGYREDLEVKMCGTLFHEVAAKLSEYSIKNLSNHRASFEEIQAFLHAEFQKLVQLRFPENTRAIIKLQLQQIQMRLDLLAEVEATSSGTILQTEFPITKNYLFKDFPILYSNQSIQIKGRIDRIEYHEQEKILKIIDLKTGNPDTFMTSVVTRKELTDLQLPLYGLFFSEKISEYFSQYRSAHLEVAYQFIGKNSRQCKQHSFQITPELLQTTEERTKRCIEGIVQREFQIQTEAEHHKLSRSPYLTQIQGLLMRYEGFVSEGIHCEEFTEEEG